MTALPAWLVLLASALEDKSDKCAMHELSVGQLPEANKHPSSSPSSTVD
jgi:hypothetical protein